MRVGETVTRIIDTETANSVTCIAEMFPLSTRIYTAQKIFRRHTACKYDIWH